MISNGAFSSICLRSIYFIPGHSFADLLAIIICEHTFYMQVEKER
jgi:hypothetical protein